MFAFQTYSIFFTKMSSTTKLVILLLLQILPFTTALGINCRGSSMCSYATFESKAQIGVMQLLRDAVWRTTLPSNTTYNSGEHIICVAENQPIVLNPSTTIAAGPEGGVSPSGSFSLSGSIKTGGICLFAQGNLKTPLTLKIIRPLLDRLLEHGCETCGSIPVHAIDQNSNDPADGILTFNYVEHPYCTERCISDDGGNSTNPSASAGNPPQKKRAIIRSAKFALLANGAQERGKTFWAYA